MSKEYRIFPPRVARTSPVQLLLLPLSSEAPKVTKSLRTLIVCSILLCTGLVASAQDTFDKAEFAARRAKVFAQIGNANAIVFANEEHPHAVRYREAPDFFYLTGIEEPGAVLVLIGARKQTIIAAAKKPEWKVRSEGPGIRDISGAAGIYGFDRIVPLDDLKAWFDLAANDAEKMFVPLTPPDQLQYAREEVVMLELESTTLPFAAGSRVKNAIAALRTRRPQLELEDINAILNELRWVKTPYEIARMRMAGKIGAEGVKEAIKGTGPGMYEYELEAAARFVYVKRGARGDAFTPIVASGPNTLIFHYNKNNRKMLAGDVVYMDYGADYDYYTSDITRTWPVGDRFTPEQEKMYRCILEARSAIIAAIKPGATVADLQNAAEQVYKKHGFGRDFLASGRYVGHFIGMSVHDVGDDDKPFVPGVVFNVEPLLSDFKNKVHVRLEDTVLVTATGSENLTADVPVELKEVYALIKQQPIGIVR